MIIDCMSDPHGHFPKLNGGDLLLIAGDITRHDTVKEWLEFYKWMEAQKYRKIIYIGGNHDCFLEQTITTKEAIKLFEEVGEKVTDPAHMEYLCNSSTEFEGLKIWGSPNSLWFYGVHPKYKAFMKNETTLSAIYANIPDDIDVLITHTPPYGTFDEVGFGYDHIGSKSLRYRIRQLKNLKLHVFGHCHQGYGQSYKKNNRHTSVNAALVDEYNRPANEPIFINFDQLINRDFEC